MGLLDPVITTLVQLLLSKYKHGMPDHRLSITCPNCRADGVTTL